ncbi:MAG: prepilin-type N-terminal cleavage/methylation domain-containing protein, partial [Candidatus Azotimanducaceae bacterium]
MFSQDRNKLTAQGGFTLMELLVVLAILGLLMSLV